MKEGQNYYRITDLAESERPRERLERLGAEALSDAELLAILLLSNWIASIAMNTVGSESAFIVTKRTCWLQSWWGSVFDGRTN